MCDKDVTYPVISWRGKQFRGALFKSVGLHSDENVPYGYDGAFPFKTYLDYIDSAHFEVQCLCGNDLLKTEEDWGTQQSHGTVDVKKFCDECGARIVVPRWETWEARGMIEFFTEGQADEWTLFYDKRHGLTYHYVHEEMLPYAAMNGWEIVPRPEKFDSEKTQ